MRNLYEYPITKDEILDYLKRVADNGYTVHQGTDVPCGDMGPTLLEAAYTIVKNAKFTTLDLDDLLTMQIGP